jgi:hypothetical protein
MGNRVIELWKESTGSFRGQLVLWVEEYPPGNEVPTNRIATHTVALDSSTISKLITLIFDSNISSLPDQEQIEGWKQGVDGITYIIETIHNNEYYIKSYWTPTSQGNLKEALIVNTFIETAAKLVNLPRELQSFTTTIPYECYMTSSMTIACKILLPAEKRRLKKERDSYRKRMMKSMF